MGHSGGIVLQFSMCNLIDLSGGLQWPQFSLTYVQNLATAQNAGRPTNATVLLPKYAPKCGGFTGGRNTKASLPPDPVIVTVPPHVCSHGRNVKSSPHQVQYSRC